MLKIEILTLGAYQTNCYVVYDTNARECVIIDPGYEPLTILDRLDSLELKPAAILLTHGHFDHVGAVETIVKATGCALWMRESDYTQLSNPMNDYLYPLHDTDRIAVNFCEEGQHIRAAGLDFLVMETPGHTWGSVCYLCEDAMFCGDTLFAGSCGRTDLPGGDAKTMMETLGRLYELEADYRIFPGHGESSTLGRERQTNPYMRGYL